MEPLFSSHYFQVTVTRIDHILGHKVVLNKVKRMKNIQRKFFDHSGINQETDIKSYSKKLNVWQSTHHISNNQWNKGEITLAIRNILN